MDRELAQVKRILLGEEYDQLIALRDDIRDEEEFQKLVSEVITEALRIRVSQDESVSDVLMPTIENAISGSINQDPKKMAESLYPIMGPAIRKSITETLNQMMDNFNQMIEQSISPKSLRWRFDAWRTGRSYSEIVLLNSLEYQVEQIFLIHRETSLLISNAVSELAESKDADMVSSMFSAIQDFIEDSFTTSEDDTLDTLRLGELNVVVARGPLATAAAVIRGPVPDFLRPALVEVLESLHQTKHVELKEYDGDTSNFEDIPPKLEPLLRSQASSKTKRKMPWLAIAALSVVMLGVVYWFYYDYQRNLKIGELKQLLDSEPGIIVLQMERSDNQISFDLMIDPDAKPITKITNEQFKDHFSYSVKRIPYFSAETKIVLNRAERILEPLSETTFSLHSNVLTVSGDATDEWFAKFNASWFTVTGVTSVDTEQLSIYSPRQEKINRLKGSIESFSIDFDKEQKIIDWDVSSLQGIVRDLKAVVKAYSDFGEPKPSISLVGFTDDTGGAILNRQLGLERANSLKESLIQAGIERDLVSVSSHLDLVEFESEATREVRILINARGRDD